ncbi:tRNA-dependent cyclodipeptide synthase [Streptomyces lunaelactis]|uniref:tRNA-dependent cyclodipeptide synthase n=1 Tax=Streptomyces lunaelactis TaxID=1535768 RepID=UPI0015846DAB|nr:tRNA-dependent cyclodipeptide synthase [Streptomyces lunaelactis]NUK51153.1 tRNA-dependent cyclodipeptide synthase [Streptomyces lunaelactis]NUK65256.1 tRNA-dependent cyclodipeptide synthase [Streptomyces lunaelactis]
MTTATEIEIQSCTPVAKAAEVFEIRPYTPHCQVICAEGDHAVIGVSPGNSYFSARRITDLAQWGIDHFNQVDFVYTDLHVAEMYETLGYTPDDARRKAVKNLRGVRAKVTSAVETAGSTGGRLRAHAMSDFVGNPAYRKIHDHIWTLLDTDAEFRQTCDTLVDSFLSSKVLDGKAGTDRQREVCLKYICAEAPLFLDTPAILGVPSSLNCYHQLLPMAELLYARGSGLRASRNQGHAMVTPVEGDSDAR